MHSFTSMLADLATICANTIQLADVAPAFTMITTPTPAPWQRRAFELLWCLHCHGLGNGAHHHKTPAQPQDRPKSGGTSA